MQRYVDAGATTILLRVTGYDQKRQFKRVTEEGSARVRLRGLRSVCGLAGRGVVLFAAPGVGDLIAVPSTA